MSPPPPPSLLSGVELCVSSKHNETCQLFPAGGPLFFSPFPTICFKDLLPFSSCIAKIIILWRFECLYLQLLYGALAHQSRLPVLPPIYCTMYSVHTVHNFVFMVRAWIFYYIWNTNVRSPSKCLAHGFVQVGVPHPIFLAPGPGS